MTGRRHIDNIVLGGLKQAEDGEGLIARLFEAHCESTTDVRIACLGTSFTADFKPGQIKTFRLGPDGHATVVDLLERPLS